MNSLVLRKSSGALFLVGVFFLILGIVIGISEDAAQDNIHFVILNLLCVILLISIGVLSLLLGNKFTLSALLAAYVVLNITYSFYYSFKYNWWQEGAVFLLKAMSSFLLPTGFLNSTSPTSILIDLTNLSVIAGVVLFFMSLKTSESNLNNYIKSSNSEFQISNKPQFSRQSLDTNVSIGDMSTNELASPAVRLGSYLLEALFTVITLGIGWLIWSFIIWGKGTTPGHQIVNLYVVSEKTGAPFTWGQMFIREILVKGLLIPLLSVVSFGIVFLVDSLMVVRDDRKTLHDRICGSIVVQR
jgi:hypothetical protein